jgi:acyl-CoA synthetase (AMP-forming)/AMP-acid ligase II
MWLSHVARRNRMVRPDALAAADELRSVTWRELDERTDRIATGLLARGVRKGERIVVSSRNRVEVLELYFAAGKAGIVVCPVNPSLRAPEVEYIARNVDAVGVLAEAEVLERLDTAFGRGWRLDIDGEDYEKLAATPAGRLTLPRQDDVFAILQTSATTGHPKGVVVTNRSISACYTAMGADAGFGPGDVMLNPCPLFHGSMVIGLALLAAGGALVTERDFTPQQFLTDVARHGATRAFLVPSMVHFLLRAKAFGSADLSSLTELMYGGSPIAEPLLRQALSRFPCRFRNVYGITEGGGPIATGVFTRADLDITPAGTSELLLRSSGRMLPGCTIEIQDEAGEPVPAGEVGEVCVRGDGTMLLYWRDTAATAEAVRDGWLRTGDLGYSTAEGHLYLVDRLSDLIIRGGQNVYPAEIERVIGDHPGVQDVAAVAAPSAEWGEVPVVFVTAGDPAPTPAALMQRCMSELASYKRPAAIRFVDEIPRSAAGKILRRVLREQLPAADGSRPAER